MGRAIDAFSLVSLIFPSFWLALVLISVFAVTLRWLPATGYVFFSDSPSDWALSLVLPVVSVAMYSITSIAKQTRDAMNDVMGRDFIRATLAQVIEGAPARVAGKPSMYNPFGLAALDLAFAEFVSRKAAEAGAGLGVPDFLV